jgi:hypothetical protein
MHCKQDDDPVAIIVEITVTFCSTDEWENANLGSTKKPSRSESTGRLTLNSDSSEFNIRQRFSTLRKKNMPDIAEKNPAGHDEQTVVPEHKRVI